MSRSAMKPARRPSRATTGSPPMPCPMSSRAAAATEDSGSMVTTSFFLWRSRSATRMAASMKPGGETLVGRDSAGMQGQRSGRKEAHAEPRRRPGRNWRAGYLRTECPTNASTTACSSTTSNSTTFRIRASQLLASTESSDDARGAGTYLQRVRIGGARWGAATAYFDHGTGIRGRCRARRETARCRDHEKQDRRTGQVREDGVADETEVHGWDRPHRLTRRKRPNEM